VDSVGTEKANTSKSKMAFHLEKIMFGLSFQGDLYKTDEYASKRKSD